MATHMKIAARVVKDELTDTFGRFYIQPLERGFGTTLGNALRRVLMTSIPGAAIASVKIDNVLHEFTTVEGVKEDVSEIIMNLKQVRLKLIDKKTDRIKLQFNGATEFKAGDIGKDVPGIQILNPDLYIATLNDNANFEMELRIAQGVSWVPAEKNKMLDFPIGTIFIDSLFSPVTKVSYKAENLPGTSRGEVLEKLTLTVETDGSIAPDDALDLAGRLLQEYFMLFSKVQSTPIDYKVEDEDEEMLRVRKLLQKSVDEMELSVRSYNCLKANNIKTIGELVSKEEADMLKFKNFGRKSLNELMAKLKSMNLEFGVDVTKYISEEDE